MKKFSKLFALSLAAALTFGMTVNAASPDTENTTPADSAITASTQVDDSTNFKDTITDVGGNVVAEENVQVAASELPAATVNDAKSKSESYLEQTGQSGDYEVAGTPTVKDFNLQDKTTGAQILYNNAVTGKMIFTVTVAEANSTGRVIAIHLKADGTPEYAGDNGGKGASFTLTVSSLSPIVFIPVDTKDDDGGDGDDTPAAVTTSVAASTGVAASPKTGETMPVAVLFAAASLGAAVVCARKARYNK